MKAIAGRNIDLYRKLFFQMLLDADQVEKRKAPIRVIVDENVQIASRLRFVADR